MTISGFGSKSKLTQVLLLVAATLLFSGMSFAQEYPGKVNQPQGSTQAYSSWLAQEVRHQLLQVPWYSVFDNLEYKVDGSEVTLLGQTVNDTLKHDAVSAVKNIEGVTKVTDNIELLPLSPMDDGIRRAEYRAIYSEPQLQRYGMGSVPPIHIIVKGGHVTLVGWVASQSDKDIAGIRAKGVPDTFAITNDLRVESPSKS